MHSGLQMLQRIVETSLPVTSGRECGVGRRVSRIPGQRLPPVWLRRAGGVPVLLEVAAGQIELLDRTDLARLRRLTSGSMAAAGLMSAAPVAVGVFQLRRVQVP